MTVANEIWCETCGVGQEAKYELRNGREVSIFCRPCFEETVFDLITSNWTVTFTEINDATTPLLIYKLG